MGLLEAQEELHVSKDCTRQFSLSTPFNKSVTGLGTISGLILAAGGVHVGVSNVGLCPTRKSAQPVDKVFDSDSFAALRSR